MLKANQNKFQKTIFTHFLLFGLLCNFSLAQVSNPKFLDFQSDDDGIAYEIKVEELVEKRDFSGLIDLIETGGRFSKLPLVNRTENTQKILSQK